MNGLTYWTQHLQTNFKKNVRHICIITVLVTNLTFTPCRSRPCGLWAKSWGSAGMQMEPPAWQPCALKRPCPSSASKRTLKSKRSQRSTPKELRRTPLPTMGHCEELGRFCWQGTHKVRETDGTSHFVTLLHRHSCQFWSHLIFWQTLPRLPSQTTKNTFPVLSSATAALHEPFCLTLSSVLTRNLGFPVLSVCNWYDM